MKNPRPTTSALVPDDEDPRAISQAVEDRVQIVEERRLAEGLLRAFLKKRDEWRGHFHSFLAVNAGLAAINLLSSIGTDGIYPWFLYVTASWGIGLLVHGLQHRSWVRDRARSIERAEALLGVSRLGGPLRPRTEPPTALGGEETPQLAAATDDGGWDGLVADCRKAVDAARRAIGDAEASPEGSSGALALASEKLEGVLETLEGIKRAGVAIRHAIREVAPSGLESLETQLGAIQARIASARDDRLRAVHEGNVRLLEARRGRIVALREEEERMRATVEGFLLAAENIRLDAIRLGAGNAPALVATLSESLDRLRDEVEVARQVERDLESL